MAWQGDENYNDVPTRIIEFRKKHPDGTLQAEIVPSPIEGFIIVKAYAYREPGDPTPGTGLAWEPVPGKTNFTRDSEVQNAETSAWGRAIIAVGAADAKKGVASLEEVRNRKSGAGVGSSPPAPGPTPPAVLQEGPAGGTSEAAGDDRTLGKVSEKPPVADDVQALWDELIVLTKGDYAKARRAIRDTNVHWATGFRATDDKKASAEDLQNAISFMKEEA